MTITITGNKGEFLYNIVTDGEKCSIVEQDAERIVTRYGRISINGDNSIAAQSEAEKATQHAQFACSCAKASDSHA